MSLPPPLGCPAKGIQLHVEKTKAQDNGGQDDQKTLHKLGNSVFLVTDTGLGERNIGTLVAARAARRLLLFRPSVDRPHRVARMAIHAASSAGYPQAPGYAVNALFVDLALFVVALSAGFADGQHQVTTALGRRRVREHRLERMAARTGEFAVGGSSQGLAAYRQAEPLAAGQSQETPRLLVAGQAELVGFEARRGFGRSLLWGSSPG